MEKSFDLGALLRNHEKKHKVRPTQFVSVAGGVRKRFETNIKCRKNNRLIIFDSIRNLPRCDSPHKQPDPVSKEQHRRMQLEKWKEEKEKKKTQAAAQKKKPFVAGVAHAPLKFVPPPPPPKVVPSTSGRVTRSQSAKNNISKPKSGKTTPKEAKIQSFAPKNALFKAPEIKNVAKVSTLTLAPQSKNKKIKETITFNPVLDTVNFKVKPKTQPKLTDNKRNKSKKAINQMERKPQGKLVRVSSSSLRKIQQSSEDNMSPLSYGSKLKAKTTKTSSQSSSEEILSPNFYQPKSKPKTSRKPVMNSENVTSPASGQTCLRTKTPKKFIESNKDSVDTPRNLIPKSESSSEEKLRSPKSPVDVPLTPEQIVEEAKRNSPFVTLSRGKANARRETKQKIDEGLLDEDASDVDSVDRFRRQLNSEIKRMTEMCDTWEKILEQIVLPDTVQEAVLGAVGQARLLMSHKLQQFASLVARCERPESSQALVTPADLHGFWDMVFMQVENVDMRFKKLEEMRARNWVEEVPIVTRRKPVARTKQASKPAVASRLRDVIAAARKAKKQDTQPEAAQDEGAKLPAQPAKTFEAGFFCVRSPVRSPVALATPARQARPSLLKAVLSSEAKKSATKNASSLAILRASLIGKTVENDSPLADPLVPLTPINLHATPARSILKPLNMPSTKKSGKKSIKVVLFDDSDVAAHDNTQTDAEEPDDMNGVKKLDEVNTDSGVSSMDVRKEKEQKENKSRKKALVRQDATVHSSPVMTRSRRKSMSTPASTVSDDIEENIPKRISQRKKALQEVELNIIEKNDPTPKRSSRRKSVLQTVAA